MKRCTACGAELELRPARCPLCGHDSDSVKVSTTRARTKPDDDAYQAKVRRLRAELQRLRDDGAEAV